MDLELLDTVAASERGAFMALRHPGTGRPIVDERTREPVGLTLRGPHSRVGVAMRRKNTEFSRELARRFKAEEIDELEMYRLAEERDTSDTLPDFVVEAHHVVVGGKKYTARREDMVALFKRFEWIRAQVGAFVERIGGFLQD